MNAFSSHNIIKLLVFILLFGQPFGNLFRVPHPALDSDVFGLQTLLVFLILSIGLFDGTISRSLNANKHFFSIFFFILIGSLLTFFEPNMFAYALRALLQNTYYALLALIIANLKINYKDCLLAGMISVSAFSLIALISLLDFSSIISVRGFNEVTGSREITGMYVERFSNLTGPFNSRTTFGNYCGLSIGGVMGFVFLGIIQKDYKKMLFFSAMLVLLLVVSLKSLSRGLILSFIITFIYFLYINFKTYKVSVRVFFPALLVLAASSIVVVSSRSNILIFLNFISSLNVMEQAYDQSSSLRYIAWMENLSSLRVWLIGRGFSLTYIPIYGEAVDAHNTFITLFRVMGIFGLFLLFTFFKKIIKFATKCYNPIALPFIGAIISYLSYGMTHTAWYLSTFWIFIGLVFNILSSKNYANR